MSLWSEISPENDERVPREAAAGGLGAQWFGIDAAMRKATHALDGELFEAIMRADLRVLALAGLVPERGYKRLGVFREAVEVMKDMERLAR